MALDMKQQKANTEGYVGFFRKVIVALVRNASSHTSKAQY
jgi:hypothetical protein